MVISYTCRQEAMNNYFASFFFSQMFILLFAGIYGARASKASEDPLGP